MKFDSSRLRELRAKKRLTQEHVAKEIGVSRAQVNYWENGRAEPSVAMISKLADLMGVRGTSFFTNS